MDVNKGGGSEAFRPYTFRWDYALCFYDGLPGHNVLLPCFVSSLLIGCSGIGGLSLPLLKVGVILLAGSGLSLWLGPLQRLVRRWSVWMRCDPSTRGRGYTPLLGRALLRKETSDFTRKRGGFWIKKSSLELSGYKGQRLGRELSRDIFLSKGASKWGRPIFNLIFLDFWLLIL